MFHFIYKTTHESGKYYIGRHSTKNIDDGYFGSGKWIRSIKDKTKLKREIIKFCSEDSLLKEEGFYINENIRKPNCMNFNNMPVGFASGSMNPNSVPEKKQLLRERILGDKNPSKRLDVRMKMSIAQKGKTRPKWKMSEEGKSNVSKGRTGIKYSEEGKKKLSESRKKEYAEGKRKTPDFTGKTHSQETITKMINIAKNRTKYACIHCKKEMHLGPLVRFHNDKCKLNINAHKYKDNK